MKNLFYLCFLLTFIFIFSCKTQATQETACVNIRTYSSGIKEIIDANCAGGCHSAQNHAHHIDLSTYELVKQEAALPEFMGALKHEEGYTAMPKGKPALSDSILQIISCWIKNGMPD